MSKETYTENDFVDSRVAWFVVLERARADRDFRRAAEAQIQLERLGVKIKYHNRHRQGDKPDDQ